MTNKTNKKKKEQAREEFNNLLNDDLDFQAQWGYCKGSQTKINENDERVLTFKDVLKEQEDAFYEWCSHYSDLKHIKRINK